MKNILLIGSGRSSFFLIRYLNDLAKTKLSGFTIVDALPVFPFQELELSSRTKYISIDINDDIILSSLIKNHDIVISLLPPAMHFRIAKGCIDFSKHFLTASYVNEDIKSLHQVAKEKGLIFMMEAGLDPGLDHLSAKKEIDEIRSMGGVIESFKSYTGGLVAPESDNNLWHYKVSWNPKNIVLAGMGGGRFLENGLERIVPYHSIFKNHQLILFEEEVEYEVYPNRNSLNYREIYELEEVQTLIRGTIRHKGFCEGWHQLVWLGMTVDTYVIANSKGMSLANFTRTFLPRKLDRINLLEAVCSYLGYEENSLVISQLASLGLFSALPIQTANATPAQVIQEILLKYLPLKSNDKDMILMQHEIIFKLDNSLYERKSSLKVTGEGGYNTAMSKTVGLPLGIICNMLLEDKIKEKGVIVPLQKYIYDEVLSALNFWGISFKTAQYLKS